MDFMTRGELAKKCRINIEALRYYEKRNLIKTPRRSRAGYRLYTEEDTAKIRFIKNAQKLGFTLNQIKDLLSLKVGKKSRCETVLIKAKTRLEEVEKKIKGLRAMRKVLSQLIDQCNRDAPTSDCPILASFASDQRGLNE